MAKNIEIISPPKKEIQNAEYQLHIEPAESPGNKKGTGIRNKVQSAQPFEKLKAACKNAKIKPKRAHSKLSMKIWNFLEWIAVSALIFIVLFFAINWGSYAELFKLKLDKLTGNFKLNPFIEQLIGVRDPINQELLPIVATNLENSTQIPALTLEIAPPDDRIIIPRINKNVPVVRVNDENLRKRDWGALESDIQEALKEGVVHYPGTAQPGEKGNVVMTGHSSYFPWDPGRFKDVFALLHEVNIGDDIIVYHDQKQVKYKVYDKKVVTPDQVDVLTQNGEDHLTLITCTPVGTNLKRLIILAKPV